VAKLLQLSRPSRRVREVVRMWWAMRCQKRRRKRAAESSGVPAAPSNLVGEDLAGGVGLTWDMTGVEGELGCEVQRRLDEVGYDFGYFGSTGPGVNHFEEDVPEGGMWQFRVRAFNASGYSDYSNVVTVEFV
jgi:hypothetical protein